MAKCEHIDHIRLGPVFNEPTEAERQEVVDKILQNLRKEVPMNTRCKVRVESVKLFGSDGSNHTAEEVQMRAVGGSKVNKDGYPSDGSDEDNTYAKFSPSADFRLYVANPVLFGQFKPGQKYYVDLTLAD